MCFSLVVFQNVFFNMLLRLNNGIAGMVTNTTSLQFCVSAGLLLLSTLREKLTQEK